jgi:hypothetical protein
MQGVYRLDVFLRLYRAGKRLPPGLCCSCNAIHGAACLRSSSKVRQCSGAASARSALGEPLGRIRSRINRSFRRHSRHRCSQPDGTAGARGGAWRLCCERRKGLPIDFGLPRSMRSSRLGRSARDSVWRGYYRRGIQFCHEKMCRNRRQLQHLLCRLQLSSKSPIDDRSRSLDLLRG